MLDLHRYRPRRLREPGSLKGLQLVVSDIEAARAELVERGVEVSEVQHFEDGIAADGPSGDWNSFIFFSDPDGNAWTVQQKPAGVQLQPPDRAVRP